MTQTKYITTLVAPGAVSDDAMDILRMYYDDPELTGIPILQDGLRLRRDEMDTNLFYACAPGAVDKFTALNITDRLTKNLIDHGYSDPKVIFLPEGLEPKVV